MGRWMNMRRVLIVLVLLATVVPEILWGQPDRRQQLLERFDLDGDGRLSATERQRAARFVEELREENQAPPPVPATIDPRHTGLYKPLPGPHAIDTVASFDLRDPARARIIPLRLTFPSAPGQYPLVIFCHGALGSKDGADPLANHWASHGYVVIRPTFGDSVTLMTAQEKARFNSVRELLNSPRTLGRWDDRPRDVKHVLDHLDDLMQKVEGLAGKIDKRQIAVAGHSFGAHTSMLIAGLKLMHPGSGRSLDLADERVTAAICISPQGTGPAVKAESFAPMTRPILMITGDEDGSPLKGQENRKGQWRREAFDLAPTGDKYLLWINNAWHGFGGINGNARWPGAGPVAPDQVLLVQSTCLAFLDAYLRDDPDARRYLADDAVSKHAPGLARVEVR